MTAASWVMQKKIRELDKALQNLSDLTATPDLLTWITPEKWFTLRPPDNQGDDPGVFHFDLLPTADGHAKTIRTLREVSSLVNNLATNPAIDEFSGSLLEVLQTSALIPFISEEFDVLSYQEVSTRWNVLSLIFSLLETFSKHKCLRLLLVDVPDTKFCLMRSLQFLVWQMNSYLCRLQQENSAGNRAVFAELPEKAKEVFDVYERIKESIASGPSFTSLAGNEDELTTEMNPGTRRELEAEYKAKMRRFQFVNCDLVGRNSFSAEAASRVELSFEEIEKFEAEFESLKNASLIDLDSSTFIAVDESRPRLLQAMITGSEGTLQANGFYNFDLLIPSGYPGVLPLARVNLPYFGRFMELDLQRYFGSTAPKDRSLLGILRCFRERIFFPEPHSGEHLYGRRRMYRSLATAEHFFTPLSYNGLSVFDSAMACHAILKKDMIKNQLRRWLADESMADPGDLACGAVCIRKLLNQISLVYDLGSEDQKKKTSRNELYSLV